MSIVATGACRADAPAAPGLDDPAAARVSGPRAVEGPCAEAQPAGARCGTVTVFEDRAAGEGKTIDLAYVVVPASAPEHAVADPVFVLAGGPGQAATSLTAMKQGSLRDVGQTRDLVFVDQRGTGASNGLQCGPTELSAMLEGPLAPENADIITGCASSLPADLAQYATPTAMDDLDDVRAALGYETINLWGGSYGTRAGLAYLRQHGEHVRSAVLWGVAPPGRPFPRTFAPVGQAALERLLADCHADAGCRGLLPDGMATVERIMERLDERPAELAVVDPRDGREVTVRLTREGFTEGLRLALYDASWSAGLPLMLAAADRGDFQPMMSLWIPLTVGILSEIHVGMFLSVACAEDVPLLDPSDEEAARETFVGDAFLAGLRQTCATWPRAELPADYLSPVRSDVPILLMVGQLDPVTPPFTAEAAAETLTRARVVQFPTVGHGTSNADECEAGLVTQFFANPDPPSLDVGCTETLARPPFVVPPR
ncbi:MAG: alpha/beta fold hydrolase [Nannocystaceae bacterium]